MRDSDPAGELVLFAETADLPVEWAVLGRDPSRPGLVLVVPADTNPRVGSADFEVSEGSPMAPLSLRCGYGVWIGEGRLVTARRTGDRLEPQDAAAARRVAEAGERGERVGSLLTEEVDADPEYRDWVEEILVPARAALTVAPAVARVIPIRRRPLFFGNVYAMAASVLLIVSLGLAGGLLWQDRKLEDLASDRTRTREELRRERERLAGEMRQAEEAHRRQMAETERKEEEARQRDRERIAELEKRLESSRRPGVLLNVPLIGLSSRDPVRGGEAEEVAYPDEGGFLFLMLVVDDPQSSSSYRLEVASKGTGRVIWTGGGLKVNHLGEVSVALSRDLLSPGDYQLRLFGLKNGKAEPAGEYELRVTQP